MTEAIPIEPITARALQQIRRQAQAMGTGADADDWSNRVVLRLIAEIDRLAYMWSKGGSDDLITGEPAADGHTHTIINGSHGCSCSEPWFPPPAESWSLPDGR